MNAPMLSVVADIDMVSGITMLRCDSLSRHKNVDFFIILSFIVAYPDVCSGEAWKMITAPSLKFGLCGS